MYRGKMRAPDGGYNDLEASIDGLRAINPETARELFAVLKQVVEEELGIDDNGKPGEKFRGDGSS